MNSSAPDRLHLDDLHVGQRFTSATHTIDEAQIKAFAILFDPQPFHTDEDDCQGHVLQRPGRERMAHRRDYDASQCRERLALGWWNHRSGRRGQLAGPDASRRYPARGKRSGRDHAFALEARSGHCSHCKPHDQPARRGCPDSQSQARRSAQSCELSSSKPTREVSVSAASALDGLCMANRRLHY